jgi:hypothetical protein
MKQQPMVTLHVESDRRRKFEAHQRFAGGLDVARTDLSRLVDGNQKIFFTIYYPTPLEVGMKPYPFSSLSE